MREGLEFITKEQCCEPMLTIKEQGTSRHIFTNQSELLLHPPFIRHAPTRPHPTPVPAARVGACVLAVPRGSGLPASAEDEMGPGDRSPVQRSTGSVAC